MKLRRRLHIKIRPNKVVIIQFPGKWKHFGWVGTWTVNSSLERSYDLGFAKVTVFISGAGAAYRLKQKEKEALRQAQQPFILLRPAFAPMADNGKN